MNQTAIARADESAFDAGPLGWVKGEIDRCLDQGVETLVAFVAEPADQAPLELARSHIHQAAGAIRMVGLEAVSVFTDEIEASLGWLQSAPHDALPEMSEAIADACTRLKLHLDALLNGAPAQPLELFPEYERLQSTRGISPSSPVDLFFPDLAVRPVRLALGQQLDAAPMSALLSRARRAFQHGMLAWLRGASEGLQKMRAAVQAIEHTQSGTQRTFWWTTTAFLDALLWRGLEPGYSAKQLCARIDLQIRRFIEGSTKVADRLRREVLYHVAISKPVVPGIGEVHAAWRLAELIPATAAEDLVRLQPALREARELLGPTKDAWLRLNSGRPDGRAKLEHHLSALVEKVGAVHHPDLSRLAKALATEVARMPVDAVPEVAALEYATALLLLESALENFSTLAPDFGRNVDAMVARLEAGGATAEQAAMPGLDEMARRAQERLLLAQVAKEIQSNLRQVEQVLDGFFRNHARRNELAGLAHPMKQIQGALRMLGLERAEQLLALCQQQIDLYARPDTPVVDDDLEMLAESLSGLGFYVESIEQQRADGERLIEPLLRKRMGVTEVRRERELSLESTLEERIAALPGVVAGLGGPNARARRTELRRRLTSLRHDAELTANAALADRAADALALVDDDTASGRGRLASIVERIVRPASAEAASTPSADALRLVSVSKEKLDAELLDIYLTEASEVLEAIRDQHQRLHRSPDDRDTLRTIRRGFHTLKGSGRMVGLTELGELAWAVEKVHNRWLEDDHPASEALLALIDVAQASFRQWVDTLRSEGLVEVDATSLQAAIARVEDELASARTAAAAPAALASGELADAVDLTVDPSLSIELPVSEADELAAPAAASTQAEGTGGTDPSAVAMDAVAQAGAAADPTPLIRVGDVTLPATLHQILCEEAQQHLQVLRRELERLHADAGATPVDAMVRASHTLQGIHRSSGITPVAEAARSLEQCLTALQRCGARLDDEAGRTLAAAVEVLATLLARVRAAEGFAATELQDADEAVTRLDALRLRAESPAPAADAAVGVTAQSPTAIPSSTLDIGQALEDVRDEIDPDLLAIFLEEAQELFPQAGDELREWQRDPGNPEAANRLRRTLHTVKGSARMAGALRLGELTHLMESRLLAGDAVVPPTGELFEMLDIDLDRIAWLLEQLQRGDYDAPLPWLSAGEASVARPGEASVARPGEASVARPGEVSVAQPSPADSNADAEPRKSVSEPPTAEAQSTISEFPGPAAVQATSEIDESPNADPQPMVANFQPVGEFPAASEFAGSGSVDGAQDAAGVHAANDVAEAPVISGPEPASFASAGDGARIDGDADARSLPLETRAIGPAPLDATPPIPWVESPAAANLSTARSPGAMPVDTTLPAAVLAAARVAETTVNEVTTAEAAAVPDVTVAEAIAPDSILAEAAPPDASTTESITAEAAPPDASTTDSITAETALPDAITTEPAASSPQVADSTAPDTVDAAAAPDVDAVAPVSTAPTGAAPPAAPDAGMTIVVAPIRRGAQDAGVAGHLRAVVPGASGQRIPDGGAEPEGRERAMLRVRADVVDRLVNEAGEVSIARARVEGELRALKNNLIELTGSVLRLRGQVRELEMHAETQIQSGMTQVQESTGPFDPLEFDRFTRFQELTRSLVEGINDVSSVQQALLKHLDDADAALVAQGRMSREVQQALFSIRTMPFGSLGDRLHRVVRQTARELGKRATLEIRGGHVELDRSVLEKLVGPLEHLVRNAIDHGVESREKRRAAGKSESGQLVIDVRQQGNEVVIALDDDGAGIDFDRLRERALATASVPGGAEPSRAQLVDLMFSAGFTTARSITKISGRGIGLDVVRSDLVALGGRIEVTSEPGAGTKFTLVLPLTLAVAQVAIVRVADRLYALPSPMVEHVEQMEATELIERYMARQMSWQGRSCPFYHLGRLLGDAENAPEADRYNAVLVVRSGANLAAIHVDQMVGNQEVVVKNIGPQLSRVAGVTGATVLGTGEVVLIINPVQLALRHEALSAPSAEPDKDDLLPQQKALTRALRVLVVDDSLTVRKITSRFLSREGFEVLVARDGIEALQVLAENRPEVILLDIEMPRMDGFEFAKAVRGDARHAGIPIVMITSRTADKHRQHARELGVEHYLGKPYQEDELLGTLRALLSPMAAVAA